MRLGPLSHQPCRPFDAARDGVPIGEAAVFALLDPVAAGAVALMSYGERSPAVRACRFHCDRLDQVAGDLHAKAETMTTMCGAAQCVMGKSR